jgi:hypothetical protein
MAFSVLLLWKIDPKPGASAFLSTGPALTSLMQLFSSPAPYALFDCRSGFREVVWRKNAGRCGMWQALPTPPS